MGHRDPQAHSEPTDLQRADLLSPVAELALALPMRVVGALRSILQPEASQPGRDGIDVSPMSGEWLRQLEVDSEKHREHD